MKWLALVAFSALLVVALTACQPTPAATVNGEIITEQSITDAIEAMRSQQDDYKTDEGWANVLASSGLTPESLRERVIDSKVQDIIIKLEAKKEGVSVDTATVDAQIAQTKAAVGGDEATWISALKRYGYPTEQDYRDTIMVNEFYTQLYEVYTPEPTQEELEQYVIENVAAYLTASAQSDDAGEQADTGDGTAAGAGDDATSEASATPPPNDGYSIPADGNVVFADVPASIVDALKAQWATANKQVKFQAWIEELVETADVQINDMPKDVPYNVDMSIATTTDSSNTSADTSAGTSTPEAIAAAEAAGLVIVDTQLGDGATATDGSTIKVLYTGMLEDGTVFDASSQHNNEPIELVLGAGKVIKGWDAGLVGMNVGGKRTLTIPGSLGYGSAGNGATIPPDATLIFEVELVSVS
jgi:FKBP-type peptidyl-prolyl cis-trans isomerase